MNKRFIYITTSQKFRFLAKGLLIFALVAPSSVMGQGQEASCVLNDKSRNALFITYEKLVKVTSERGESKAALLLRLHNNSTCTVLITTGSAEKFIKPPAEGSTILRRITTEIDYDLPDGALVPQLQYRYHDRRGAHLSVGGDNFYGFNLSANKSILFEVPFKHLNLSLDGTLAVKFQYAWEMENRSKEIYSSVENYVHFATSDLPESVKEQIRRY